MTRTSYVYISTNKTRRVLYTGVTSNLARRLHEHRQGTPKSFTRKYNATKLVYVETFYDVRDAIAREKQIKAGSRQKKIDLINKDNPEWRDLSDCL